MSWPVTLFMIVASVFAIATLVYVVVDVVLELRDKKEKEEEKYIIVVPPVEEEEEEPEVIETTAVEPEVVEPEVVEPEVVEPEVVEPEVVEPEVVEPEVVEPEVVEEPKEEQEITVVAPVIFAEGAEGAEAVRLVNGMVVPVRYRTSFMSRLIQADPPVQDYYTLLKNYILAFKGVKARTSWNFESFNKGRLQCVKLNVKGTTLQIYLALDPAEYSEDKYHHFYVGDRPKLDKVPMMMKIKSERALKYAFELVDEVMLKNEIARGDIPEVDYHMPYESTEDLVDKDLVKVILPDGFVVDDNTVIERVDVGELLKGYGSREFTPIPRKEVVEEVPVEETVEPEMIEQPIEEIAEPEVVEEPVAEEPATVEVVEATEPVEIAEPVAIAPAFIVEGGEDGDAVRLVNGVIVAVRYRTSFTSRLIQSEPPVQDYYTIVKNYTLAFKGIKARTSWNFESFNKGRIQCVKINVKGTALQVYLGLDPAEYNEDKYHFVFVGDKPKLDKVPMMMKVKSERALKYTLELIDEVMLKNGIERGEIPEVDYHMPYETTEELVDKDLVKIILPDGMVVDENTIIEKVNVGELLKDAKPAISEPVSTEVETVEETLAEPEAIEQPIEAVEEVVEEPVETAEPEIVEEVMPEIVEQIDAEEADALISDELAMQTANLEEGAGQGKQGIINIGVINKHFEPGDTVTLAALKEKGLVPKKIGRIKILADGMLDKALTTKAESYSVQAIKMIELTGGTVIILKD